MAGRRQKLQLHPLGPPGGLHGPAGQRKGQRPQSQHAARRHRYVQQLHPAPFLPEGRGILKQVHLDPIPTGRGDCTVFRKPEGTPVPQGVCLPDNRFGPQAVLPIHALPRLFQHWFAESEQRCGIIALQVGILDGGSLLE